MRWLPRNRNRPKTGRSHTTANPIASTTALWVRNTSPYPLDQVEMLIGFSFAEVNNVGVEVHVKGSNRIYRGRAYNGIPGMANVVDSARYLVTIGLSRTKKGVPTQVFPGTKRLRRQYPAGIPVENWQDLLVYVAAHEARHIWQFQARRMGQEMAFSEVDADCYAIDLLGAWRRTTGRNPFNE